MKKRRRNEDEKIKMVNGLIANAHGNSAHFKRSFITLEGHNYYRRNICLAIARRLDDAGLYRDAGVISDDE